MDPTLVGWREWVGLPDLGVKWIKAKVDTGARSSALHAFDVSEYRRAGALWVKFAIHPIQRSERGVVEARARVEDQRYVMSSSGDRQLRYVIKTELVLGEVSSEIELTLARRDELGFRMLLGRQSVRGKYLVDPGKSFLTQAKPR